MEDEYREDEQELRRRKSLRTRLMNPSQPRQRPAALAARHILAGVYATDSQVTLTPEGAYQLQAELAQRLDDSVAALATEGLRLPPSAAFEPVHFSQVRCSA